MDTPRSTKQEIRKLLYFIKKYPHKDIKEIALLFQMPNIVVNNMIWTAKREGYIDVSDKGEVKLIKAMKTSNPVDRPTEFIRQEIIFMLTELAEDEEDIEEYTMTTWLTGYPIHNQLVALMTLEDEGVVKTYKQKDEGSTYKFYTLADNLDKKWGLKQFKRPPVN